MSAVIPDDSKKTMAAKLLATEVSEGWVLLLYQNDYTPTHATVIGDLVEADFSGYASVILSGGAVAGSLDAGNRAVITWDLITFTKSGATGNQIFGYYVIDDALNLLWAERATSPPLRMVVDGDEIKITPKLTDKSEFSNS